MALPLQLDRSPRGGVIMPWFHAAPVFGMLSMFVLLAAGPAVWTSRWHPGLLAAVHGITLGVLGSVMLGAAQQLTAVLCGRAAVRSRRVAAVLFGCWTTGGLLMLTGFAWQAPELLVLAWPLLGGAGLVLAGLLALAHWRGLQAGRDTRGMLSAIAAFGITVLLGLRLLAGHAFPAVPVARALTDWHAGWGLAGWIGLLVMAVSWRVVPMFQHTPAYPYWAPALPLAVFAGLLLALAWPTPGLVLVTLSMAGHALLTLHLQARRARREFDITVAAFRFAMLAWLAALALFWVGRLVRNTETSNALFLTAGVVYLLGFALGCVNGMLARIIPFLLRLYLQARFWHSGHPLPALPRMDRWLPHRWQAQHLYAHNLGVLLLAVTALRPTNALHWASTLLLAGTWCLQAMLMIKAWQRYLEHRPTPTFSKESYHEA